MVKLSEDLEFRGLVHQVSDPSLVGRLDSEHLTAYIGFDPTADSLHIGNLLQLCNLRRLQEAGHRPITVAGGGTGLIGDPGGKADERPLLSREDHERNLAGIRPQLERFLDFSPAAGEARALVVDNGDWLGELRLIEFLRDVGKHFSVNQMVQKESVRARLARPEHGISYTEFSYMLLQAYDFLYLYDRYGCRLQMGASDQWGNITMGVDLIRRVRGGEAYALTSPLVVRPDGTKFGKSESGTVWLDAERTSPYELYQFFVRVEDSVVGTYLRYFTWRPHDELIVLDAETAERPERREAQRVLAFDICALVHGEAEAGRAEVASRALFTEELASLDEETLLMVFADAPSSILSRSALADDGLDLVAALVESNLVASKSAARTAVAQGGVYVNNVRRQEPARISAEDLVAGRYVVLRRGRKDHHLLRFE